MGDNVTDLKSELRKKILSSRSRDAARLSSSSFTEAAVKLCESLEVSKVGCYLSFGEEPPTAELIAALREKQIVVASPKINAAGEMVFVEFSPVLQKSELGFMEPIETLEVMNLELVIMPALAIDRAGRRLGRGGGFFDRFLSGFSGIRVALVFDEEVVDSLPSEPHDQPVDYALTPKRTIQF
jgi:5-formyltetrahydrofolate cyclo-ligase